MKHTVYALQQSQTSFINLYTATCFGSVSHHQASYDL